LIDFAREWDGLACEDVIRIRESAQWIAALDIVASAASPEDAADSGPEGCPRQDHPMLPARRLLRHAPPDRPHGARGRAWGRAKSIAIRLLVFRCYLREDRRDPGLEYRAGVCHTP
jgi:hypothetical protein